ncbi:MAG: hypothetical protein U0800_15525 [Isosphaeraceae bacterium]
MIVTGMGKAGLVGQKLAAMTSTGTRAFPLHPAEAFHGDGRITPAISCWPCRRAARPRRSSA